MMQFALTLLIFLHNGNFKNALLSLRNLEIEKGDSLLNVAFFESDSLLKNDILLIKEILTRFRGKEEVKILAQYYLSFYFSDSMKFQPFGASEEVKGDLINYLKLLNNLSKNADFNSCKNSLAGISDTVLLFHGTFAVVKKFKNSYKNQCFELLNNLVSSYPQTPYSEIASGYLKILKNN